MKMQSISVAFTAINLIILLFLLAQLKPSFARQQQQYTTSVLRGRALEIVDSLGKVRASITIQPPVEVEGKKYPQTVLLRLIDTKGGPLVKLGAAENGSGLSLSDELEGGVLIHARNAGSFVKITNGKKEQIIQP